MAAVLFYEPDALERHIVPNSLGPVIDGTSEYVFLTYVWT